MLPVESLADVVSFLGYYEFGGLKLATKLLSAVATQRAEAIRRFDFSAHRFYIGDSWIDVCRDDESGLHAHHVRLELTSDDGFAEFASEAFRNCSVGRFYLSHRCENVLDALKAIANTMIVADTLVLYFGVPFAIQNVNELFELVDSFLRVKRLDVRTIGGLTSDEKERLEDLCRRKNIENSTVL